MSTIYIIGSLRNPLIPKIEATLREDGWDVFASWFSAGERADDSWQAHETAIGHDYPTALKGYAAQHVFNFDKTHLERSDIGLLVMPAGKSGHLELGWMLGRGKRGYILYPGVWPERWDVMTCFADGVYKDLDELRAALVTPSGCGPLHHRQHSWDIDGFGSICEFCRAVRPPKVRKATFNG